jgi:phosphatidylethanolamine/phosphatidyl-N-methylethanolamine N-methyltransferase
MRFFGRFLRHPMRVGAVAPSSRFLARQAIAPVARAGDPVVVELGPGTGAFTHAIQHRLGGRGRHIAIEIDATFAEVLRSRYSQLEVVVGDAATLPDVLAARGIAAADAVVSGLPWSAFAPDRARSVLDAVAASLAPHGAFTTFAYLHAIWAPPARRLRRDLERTFQEVVPGRTVWANMPAALVYHARSPAR